MPDKPRKYPHRSKEWPCPACGQADCDLDTEITWHANNQWVYSHTSDRIGAK